ncbi:serine/threonine-protein kinase [Clostridium saudiense]|uniref:serine/threonine-protein kinase n=1 Tax=Clostridium saudiense TaxID=1414720 RepID=UPI00319E35D0
MENVSFDEIESKYSELTELNNSAKSNVYLVRSEVDGRIYIKKELKNYNIDVYKQIMNIENFYMARVYEVFKCEDSLIVIEEFINGQTLQAILDNEGPLEEAKAIKYMINLCSILDVLHNLNPAVIHRDIKPSNIIIDNNGILKLIDFDVSRVYKEERNMDTHILGTKGYAPPEQFGFEQTDCRSDIYSVGVMLNVLTTGKHIKEELNEGKLKGIIKKCTNISPDNRYSNVKELKKALENVLYYKGQEEYKETVIKSENSEPEFIKDKYKQEEEERVSISLSENKYTNEKTKKGVPKIKEKEASNNENLFSNKEKVYNNFKKSNEKEKLNLNKFGGKKKVNLNKADEKEKLNLNKIDKEENLNSNLNKGKKHKKINIISEIKDLPGCGARNPFMILGASLWYLFLAFGFFCNWGSGDITLILEDIFVVALLLSFTLFNGNYKNIKSKLPLTRSNVKNRVIAGVIIYNIVIFMIYGIITELI